MFILSLTFFLPCLCAFLILLCVCFRERYPTRLIRLRGYTVRPLPRHSDLRQKFGILCLKPKIGWSKAFVLGTSRSSFPLPTRTTGMISSTRCLSYPLDFMSSFILIYIISCFDIFFLLISVLNSYLCGRLTVISPPFSSLIWQSKNFKRWLPHMWMPISRPSGFVGGTPLLMSRKRIDFRPLSLLGRKSSKTGSTKPLFGRRCNSSFFPLYYVISSYQGLGHPLGS